MAYAAIDKHGNFGAAASQSPFPFAVTTPDINELHSGYTLFQAD